MEGHGKDQLRPGNEGGHLGAAGQVTQHTKVRNRLGTHRVERLLFIQINMRQYQAEQPTKVTQELLLEEEDNEIERVLQRKQVQDHLSEGSDTSSNSASSPTSSPTP